ncbi:hypothetical protein [Egbenema bharatensis]|uniref:hypothetical protein n=1 Tax=Egbenema bharatensis TaxID=3463334 RepID=UPI003A8C850D
MAEPLPSNISDLMDGEVGTPIPELTTTALHPGDSSCMGSGVESTTAFNIRSSHNLSHNAASSPSIEPEPGLELDEDNVRSPAPTIAATTAPQNVKHQTFQTREGDITVEYADELQEHQNGIFQGLTWPKHGPNIPIYVMRWNLPPIGFLCLELSL